MPVCFLARGWNNANVSVVCKVDCQPILTDRGHVDNDVEPFALPVPSHGFRRFHYRQRPAKQDSTPDYCYPFHAACWSLLQESNDRATIQNNLAGLFDVFECFPYNRKSRCLAWGNDYSMADMLDEDVRSPEADIIAVNKSNTALLADPLGFKLHHELHESNQQLLTGLETPRASNHTINCSRLLSLPYEILDSIFCSIDFHDIQNLVLASGDYDLTLSRAFWRSRFFGAGETAFARSICPSDRTWKNWYFQVRKEMESGPNKTSLQNRQRIWKLGIQLGTMVHAVNDPRRTLYGEVSKATPIETRGSVSCVALQSDARGCQELKRVYVHLGERSCASRVCSVSTSHVIVSGIRLISGITFTLNDGQSINAGYVTNGRSACATLESPPEFLWLVFSTLGLEAISLGEYPQQFINQCTPSRGHDLAVTRWPLDCISAISLGLDVCSH